MILEGRGVRRCRRLVSVLLSAGSRRRNLETGARRLPFERWSEGWGWRFVLITFGKRAPVVVHLDINKSRASLGGQSR